MIFVIIYYFTTLLREIKFSVGTPSHSSSQISRVVFKEATSSHLPLSIHRPFLNLLTYTHTHMRLVNVLAFVLPLSVVGHLGSSNVLRHRDVAVRARGDVQLVKRFEDT